ncbi:RNA polymerase sigma factor [Nocardia carnea]|uniref:RNA polymerase sigma factor n=1 Tax=Nocardia carnea TaxID=37328 RepID=UPI0024540311|nr:DUF6596 domain-containing protein [Nocardia carnea]
MTAETPVVAEVWRREAPHILTALLRRHGDLGECEDAAQEAAEAATVRWARDGLPDNPRAGREAAVAAAQLGDIGFAPAADLPEAESGDDTLRLFLLCCHPSLTRSSQVALTLHAVAGIPAERIAAAYLVPERTMAQRLTRARATLRRSGARFELPAPADLPDRLAAVLDTCHLMFTAGHTVSAGASVHDPGLAEEAIRLTRILHRAVPDHDEVAGALALMLLTHARAAARTDTHGELVPLAEQDRSRWNGNAIAEGIGILERVLPRGYIGRYQLEAAIAAVHAEAGTWESTDWRQIVVLYAMLDRVAPGPAVTLNRAVAVAMVAGPEAGLRLTEPLLDEPAMRRHHRTYAVRGHLLEMAGDPEAARVSYRRAAALTASLPEQRYLNARLRRLGSS